MPIRRLSGTFPSRHGVPVIGRVDTGVFTHCYFTHCLDCGFCRDACCQYGVDVDFVHADAIASHADALEAYTGMARSEWFTGEIERDADMPGGGSHRTAVRDGRCVFLRRNGRGCLLHAYCDEHGLDYHDLKSIVDCLFPLSYYDDVLCTADEIAEASLICMDTGPTLYRGLRDEVRFYFGEDCVAALDAVERALQEA